MPLYAKGGLQRLPPFEKGGQGGFQTAKNVMLPEAT
jgi:hypothetical protein